MTENEKLIKDEQEAIEVIKSNMPTSGYYMLREACEMAIKALEEVQEYRKIGTVEEYKKSVKEENVLKFYYCESEDDYYIGKSLDNFYYAKYEKTGFVWFMSRYLPWGEHIIAPHTLWKEYTYPSEPKEIPFNKWIQGFLKKYCGGTVEECREALEKTKAKKPDYEGDGYADGQLVYDTWICPNCGEKYEVDYDDYNHCPKCGQKIDRSDENE